MRGKCCVGLRRTFTFIRSRWKLQFEREKVFRQWEDGNWWSGWVEKLVKREGVFEVKGLCQAAIMMWLTFLAGLWRTMKFRTDKTWSRWPDHWLLEGNQEPSEDSEKLLNQVDSTMLSSSQWLVAEVVETFWLCKVSAIMVTVLACLHSLDIFHVG